jgi:small-conductance mechanosensitive channel
METSTDFWKRESVGATEKMTNNTSFLATSMTHRWHDFWRGDLGEWIISRGLRIVMVLIAAMLAARFVNWVAQQVTHQLNLGFAESDALVRSEASKHRQALASVISWVSVVIIGIWVIMQISAVLQFSVGGLVAPATVVGAALGFGAQQLVRDLLAGFFILVERQYGFGDLVTITVVSATDASGTVENVTLRVTRLRSSDGEVLTIPNGQIVKVVNLSKDWARAVVDIPVSTNADLNRVNEVLHQECERAMDNPVLGELLLDAPTVMGVESIAVDTVTLRLVARTLPGKQFEVGRQLRVMVIRALARVGIVTAADARVGLVEDPSIPAAQAAEPQIDEVQGAVQKR